MTLAEALSIRVNKLLKDRGITQYRLFKLSGVSQSTISDIRNMKNGTVNIKLIYGIAQGFGMSLKEFFDDPIFDDVTD